MGKKGRDIQYHIKDEEFRSVCAAARTAYFAAGRIPTLDEIDAVCDVSTGRIAKVLVKEEFVTVMKASGINWTKNKGLNAKQHYMLMVLTNPNDKRSFEQRLKDGGVTRTEYSAWMRQPAFKSIIEEFAERALGDHMVVAHDSLMKQVEKGNTRAIEFYYAMTGRYSANSQQERDLQAVLTGVIDIIQRNVTDPAVLANIASEMKTLMGAPVRTAGALTAYREEMAVEDAHIINDQPVADQPFSIPEPIRNIIPPVAKKKLDFT